MPFRLYRTRLKVTRGYKDARSQGVVMRAGPIPDAFHVLPQA
jgi:hypothetical protein